MLDGQTILIEDYLALRPRMEARIKRLVARGALEVGPWYVLSDLLMPAAASLRRNLAEGAHDSARFGKRLDVLYSPDAFGHPAELPALAGELGIHRAVIRRGLGRPQGQDHDLWRWEAKDGQSLLVYHLAAGGYDSGTDLVDAKGDLRAVWSRLRRDLVARAGCEHIAVFLGADHHAMVRELSGLRARLQALEPKNEVRISGLTEFFDGVEGSQPNLAVLRGELRTTGNHTWVLQDVHSTRARMKRQVGWVELFLSRIAEPLARLTGARVGSTRQAILTGAWRTLLQCQFHDTLAGTTSDAVQAEQKVRLDAAMAVAREVAGRSLQDLAGYDPDRAREEGGEPRLILWNPGSRARSGITTAELTFFRGDIPVGPPSGVRPRSGPGHHPFALIGPNGEILSVQVLAVRRGQERRDFDRHYPDQDEVDRVWVALVAPEVAAQGTAELSPKPLPRAIHPAELRHTQGKTAVRTGPHRLENEYVSVQVSPGGVLTLHDGESRGLYTGCSKLIDEPDRGDLYTRSPGKRRGSPQSHPLSHTIVAPGPMIGAIETTWWMSSAGEGWIGVRQLVVLHADSPLVRIRLDLDHHAVNHRLRIGFPAEAGISGVRGTALGWETLAPVLPDTRLGLIERPATTVPAHRFARVGARSRGVAVFSPGFFEAELTPASELMVTLIRAVGELAREGLPERPGRAAWPLSTPGAQEPGRHTIHLGLKVGASGAEQPAELEAVWEDAFLPIQSLAIREF